MLKLVKQLILQGSKAVGLQSTARDSSWRRQRLLVLCYHGISAFDEHEWNPELYMPTSVFRRRLEILRDGGYYVVPLDEAVDRLYAGDLPPRSVVITFDDGAADFYTQAFPLLREFGFPSTVYLTTYYSRYNRPVFDVTLPYLLWKGRGTTLDRDVVGQAGEWRLSDPGQREAARKAIWAHALASKLGGAAKDALLEELAGRLGVDFAELRARRILHLMKESEVAEVAANGVSIQLHTHHHRTPREPSSFAREIEVNREHIDELTGQTSQRWHFCYPNGWYHPEFVPWLRQLEVRSATTCEPGMATRATEPILLPRLVDTTLLSEIEFEGWLSGVSSFLPGRLRLRADGRREY
jgi:peptidoglycan/xylan/chitin deacetylase (PgdA/CDA1 family)